VLPTHKQVQDWKRNPNLIKERETKMDTNNNVVEVFGQFAVQVAGKTKMYDTRVEAETADVLERQGAGFVAKAKSFTQAIELAGKQAKQQENVVVAFLAWEAGKATEV